MNNRYLYRAKTRSGLWVQGFLSRRDNKYYISNKAGMPFAYEVVEDTICQCTGLRDKKGDLIWENDIVAYHFGKTCAPICFGSYQSCFDNTKTEHVGFYVNWNDKCNYRKDLGYWINMIEADVVGNIFDNPELLEQEG